MHVRSDCRHCARRDGRRHRPAPARARRPRRHLAARPQLRERQARRTRRHGGGERRGDRQGRHHSVGRPPQGRGRPGRAAQAGAHAVSQQADLCRLQRGRAADRGADRRDPGGQRQCLCGRRHHRGPADADDAGRAALCLGRARQGRGAAQCPWARCSVARRAGRRCLRVEDVLCGNHQGFHGRERHDDARRHAGRLRRYPAQGAGRQPAATARLAVASDAENAAESLSLGGRNGRDRRLPRRRRGRQGGL